MGPKRSRGRSCPRSCCVSLPAGRRISAGRATQRAVRARSWGGWDGSGQDRRDADVAPVWPNKSIPAFGLTDGRHPLQNQRLQVGRASPSSLIQSCGGGFSEPRSRGVGNSALARLRHIYAAPVLQGRCSRCAARLHSVSEVPQPGSSLQLPHRRRAPAHLTLSTAVYIRGQGNSERVRGKRCCAAGGDGARRCG